MTQFQDKLTLDGVKRTQDGYLVADVKAARTGIQVYSGDDVGRPGVREVRVYRPPEEVFDGDSMRSYAYRPVVLGHPREGVDAVNWKDLARGITGGEIARDGDFIRVPLALMDAAAIKAVEDGTREVSMGYSAEIEFIDGVTPAGEPYDAIQRKQRMNHLAIVDAARGGSNLRIGDQLEEPTMANRTVMLDGLPIETTDAGAAAIEKLQRDLKTVRDAATADLTTRDATITQLRADLAKKEGEAAVMKKQIDDAVLTPAKLDAAVLARSTIINDAKKIGGDAIEVAGKTDMEIKRSALSVSLGDDAVKAMADAAIDGAFAYAAKQAEGDSNARPTGVAQLRTVLTDRQALNARQVADKAWEDHVASLENGYKTPRPEAAAGA